MALARNTDLSVSQSNRRIAGYQIIAAEGAYDLQFVLTPSYSLAKTPAISSFQSGPNGSPPQQITLGSSAQIGGLTGSGGQFTFGTSAQRIDSSASISVSRSRGISASTTSGGRSCSPK